LTQNLIFAVDLDLINNISVILYISIRLICFAAINFLVIFLRVFFYIFEIQGSDMLLAKPVKYTTHYYITNHNITP